MSLVDRLIEHSRARPDRRAVVCDGRSLTYAALVAETEACGARLRGFGFTSGSEQRVGVLAANGLDYAVLVAACQLAGIAIVPLPGLIAPDAHARMLDDSGVSLLFHDADHADKARTAVDLSAARDRVTLAEIGGGASTDPDARGSLAAWIGDAETAPFAPGETQDAWVSDLIYSSGTTGTPKGITQSFGSRKAQCISLASLGFSETTAFLHTIGLYSNFGLSALLLSFWWGGTFFMMRKFSGAAAVDVLSREAIDMAWFAPATLIRTAGAPGYAEAVHNKPCTKLSAGAPLSVSQKQQILDTWPGPFFEVYGQTETGTLTMLAAHASPPDKLGSVGRALPSVSVKIIDDTGSPVPAGQEGEIVGHSTTLMSGYHEREDANASAHWRDENGRIYIRTGDVGRFDADEYLWLCDRMKDMIISGGYNIYPADIERVLVDHPAVSEAAVVGYASMKWGESPVAFVTLRDGATLGEDELRAWVNTRVGSIQRLAALKILSELPSGAMGKILKRDLRDKYAGAIGGLP